MYLLVYMTLNSGCDTVRLNLSMWVFVTLNLFVRIYLCTWHLTHGQTGWSKVLFCRYIVVVLSPPGLQQSGVCTEHSCQVNAKQPGWAERGDCHDRARETVPPHGLWTHPRLPVQLYRSVFRRWARVSGHCIYPWLPSQLHRSVGLHRPRLPVQLHRSVFRRCVQPLYMSSASSTTP